ncbi:MAG: hypothetical protein ACMV1D_07835 [Macromonas sp.]
MSKSAPNKKKLSPQAVQGQLLTAFEQAAHAAGLPCANGKSAVESRYRGLIEAKLAKATFTGSVDMDTAFKASEGKLNRWDYGLGLQAEPNSPECAVWVEPHSAASTGEVAKLLAKLDWLQAKLKTPGFEGLRALTEACTQQGVRPFHWMSTAHVSIRPGSREARQLAQRGLMPPTTRVVL